MKIGIVSPEYAPAIGGVETYAANYAHELASRGHEVTVYTRPHAEVSADIPGARIKRVLKLARGLDLPTLQMENIDAWHVMNAAYSWLALDLPQPVVVSVHGNDFLRPYCPVARPVFERVPFLSRSSALAGLARRLGHARTPHLIANALPRATHILANSKYTERVFLDRFPACQGRTTVAYVGVSSDFLAGDLRQNRNRVPKLLTVSRLSEPRKNVDRVLHALARLNTSFDFRYTVIGDGPQRPVLENLSRALGLADRVSFKGALPKDSLINEMHAADLFVLTASITPESHEGFGIVYLEAAASGVPSLAARLAGAAEAVEEGKSGYFAERPEVGDISEAIARFLRKEVSFSPIACRAFARSFSWSSVVDRALPYYEVGPRTAPSVASLPEARGY